ncbi:MAG: 50S ribosomal protein L22 [Chloroflexota bacterium]|nr:MAG: 50S ribosomal protein L22 [Chloroflexota bacterium]
MEVVAHARNIRIAPRKVRLVVGVVRGKGVDQALAELRVMPQKAAKEVFKAVHSAVANAENNYGLDRDTLVVSRIWANEARTLKRWRPRAHGRVSPLLSRSSHVTVIVDERRPQ